MNYVEIEMMTDSKDLKYDVDGVKPKYFQLECHQNVEKLPRMLGKIQPFNLISLSII